MASVNNGLDAARATDDDTAAQEFALAARSLNTADSTLSSWFVAPAKTLPLIGPNLTVVGSVSAQASDVARVTSLAASAADVDALRFVGGRLDPAAAGDMIAPLQQVMSSLDLLAEQVDDVQSPWLIGPVAEPLGDWPTRWRKPDPRRRPPSTRSRSRPILLGGEGPQRYLVLFTTPVEARGRTGFPGNFAELLITDGKLSMPRFGRISELDGRSAAGAAHADPAGRLRRPVRAVRRDGDVAQPDDERRLRGHRPRGGRSSTRSRAASRSTAC